jgi:hypothetical protein
MTFRRGVIDQVSVTIAGVCRPWPPLQWAEDGRRGGAGGVVTQG